MKSEELRIGNLVKISDIGTCEILGVMPNKIYYTPNKDKRLFENMYSMYCYINPITLTGDWLLKFGFEKKDSQRYILQKGKKINIPVAKFKFEEHITFEGLRSVPIDLLYVHQLQNLYFALTGQELKLKE